MKRKLLVSCWSLIPVVLLAYHYGPGQNELARDAALQKIVAAEKLEREENWRGAMETYGEALAKMPPGEQAKRWQVRLAQTKARMYSGDLPEAMAEMETLLGEMQKETASAGQRDEVRANLAAARYYAGWLMRLEGAPAAEWSVEVENARQHFRLLAENNLKANPPQAKRYQENLEATIRLARMDISELEGMPLPKFCEGCKNVSQKCRSQCQSKAKKPAEKEQKDARGAGHQERPRGGS